MWYSVDECSGIIQQVVDEIVPAGVKDEKAMAEGVVFDMHKGDDVRLPADCNLLTVGLGWDCERRFDLDSSVIVLSDSIEVADTCFYANRVLKTDSSFMGPPMVEKTETTQKFKTIMVTEERRKQKYKTVTVQEERQRQLFKKEMVKEQRQGAKKFVTKTVQEKRTRPGKGCCAAPERYTVDVEKQVHDGYEMYEVEVEKEVPNGFETYTVDVEKQVEDGFDTVSAAPSSAGLKVPSPLLEHHA